MISTSNRQEAKRPAFITLLVELGVILFIVSAWAHTRGTLLGASWEPVYTIMLAGLFFGPVKHLFVLPDREKAKGSKASFLAHLFKTSVLAAACAVAAVAVVG